MGFERERVGESGRVGESNSGHNLMMEQFPGQLEQGCGQQQIYWVS